MVPQCFKEKYQIKSDLENHGEEMENPQANELYKPWLKGA